MIKDFKQGGIYCIKNIKTQKVYIGSTINFKRRFCEHLKNLRSNKHACKHLQKAFNKDGEKYFYFCIVEYIQNSKLLLNREQYWFCYYGIGNHNKCYNTSIFANCATRGRKLSSQHKQRISIANKGKKHNEESKRKMSIAKKGKPLSDARLQSVKKWSELKKQNSDHFGRSIICLETGEIYKSAYEAQLKFKTTTTVPFVESCRDKEKTAQRYHWMFLDEFYSITPLSVFDRLLCGNLDGAEKIYNLDTNEIYNSKKDCCKQLNISITYLNHILDDFVYYPAYPKLVYTKNLNDYKKGKIYLKTKQDSIAPGSKKIICLSTEIVFDSIQKACNFINRPNSTQALLHACIKGNLFNNQYWMFYQDYLEL